MVHRVKTFNFAFHLSFKILAVIYFYVKIMTGCHTDLQVDILNRDKLAVTNKNYESLPQLKNNVLDGFGE